MRATTGAQRGFTRIFSAASFFPPPRLSLSSPAAKPAPAVPNSNIFVSDLVTGYSTGLGFVKYATLEDATKGIEGMDGKFLDGWVIFAEYARP